MLCVFSPLNCLRQHYPLCPNSIFIHKFKQISKHLNICWPCFCIKTEWMQDAEEEGVGFRTAAVHVGMHRLSGDIRALLRGERPVPMLALDHRKLLLLLKLGRSRNIWWNSPTGHLCDKWIKLDKVMLAAIGFYLLVKSEPDGTGPSVIFIISYVMSSDCRLDFTFLSNNWNELKKTSLNYSANTFHESNNWSTTSCSTLSNSMC